MSLCCCHSSLTCTAAQQGTTINVQSQISVGVSEHCDDETDQRDQLQQTLQDVGSHGDLFLWSQEKVKF